MEERDTRGGLSNLIVTAVVTQTRAADFECASFSHLSDAAHLEALKGPGGSPMDAGGIQESGHRQECDAPLDQSRHNYL